MVWLSCDLYEVLSVFHKTNGCHKLQSKTNLLWRSSKLFILRPTAVQWWNMVYNPLISDTTPQTGEYTEYFPVNYCIWNRRSQLHSKGLGSAICILQLNSGIILIPRSKNSYCFHKTFSFHIYLTASKYLWCKVWMLEHFNS